MTPTTKTGMDVAPLQEHSDPMEELARQLNSQLSDDFPNAKLRWPHADVAPRLGPQKPIEHAGRLAQEAGDVAGLMKELAHDLLGTLPQVDEPHSTKVPAGVLPKVAALEDVTARQLATIRRLIDHIRVNL